MDADEHKFEELKHQVIRTGGYYVHFYFDMHANDEQSLKESMVGFVSKLTKEEGVRYAIGEIDEATEKDKLYSSTAKVSKLIHDLPAINRITMAYGPVGIDLEEPNESRVSVGEMQAALMGISAMAQDLTQYIIQKKLLDPSEKAKFDKQMAFRIELGQKLLADAKKAEDEKGEAAKKEVPKK